MKLKFLIYVILSILIVNIVYGESWEIDLSSNYAINNNRNYYYIKNDSQYLKFYRYINGRVDYEGYNLGDSLNIIKNNSNSYYIKNNKFLEILKSNKIYLDGFYLHSKNIQWILNYFYNSNSFSNTNYIHYDDYVLLYDYEGYAVESIVNGVWAGLYDNPSESGYLYNANGELSYVNGQEPTFFDKINEKLFGGFSGNFLSVIDVSIVKLIFFIALVFAVFFFVLRILRRKISGVN